MQITAEVNDFKQNHLECSFPSSNDHQSLKRHHALPYRRSGVWFTFVAQTAPHLVRSLEEDKTPATASALSCPVERTCFERRLGILSQRSAALVSHSNSAFLPSFLPSFFPSSSSSSLPSPSLVARMAARPYLKRFLSVFSHVQRALNGISR